MINCLLIKITHNSRGLPVRSYRTINAHELTFGRGAECNVHLPDPRIAMHHAVIKHNDLGQPVLQAINGEIEVEGAITTNIALTHGTKAMVGPYEIKVEPAPPDVNLAISVTLAHRLPDDYQDLKSRTHQPLAGGTSFKRRLSVFLAILIALIFIALPLAQNLIPKLHSTMAELPFGFDRAWSPGRISPSHMHFGSQCSNCHKEPLNRVSDKACMTCHRDTAPHIADPALQKRVFNAAHRFVGTMRCAECHQEHKAPHPLARQDNGMCVKCHGNIKAADPNTKLTDIHDFDLDHPEFRLSIRSSPDAKEVERISQTDKARLVENSGLKFPHSQHVGKVQGPNGIWDVRELACTSCHIPEGKEMRFKPLSFKNNCVSCHAKELEIGPKEHRLTLPHGDEESMFNALQLYAPKEASRNSDNLKENGCAYCHEIAKTKEGDTLPWRVATLHINEDWFSKASFNHGAHRSQQCKSCHDVETSESSKDIAIPDRKSCLLCHSGNTTKHKRIASSCMSCHNFHSDHKPETLIPAGKVDDKDIAAMLSVPNEPK